MFDISVSKLNKPSAPPAPKPPVEKKYGLYPAYDKIYKQKKEELVKAE